MNDETRKARTAATTGDVDHLPEKGGGGGLPPGTCPTETCLEPSRDPDYGHRTHGKRIDFFSLLHGNRTISAVLHTLHHVVNAPQPTQPSLVSVASSDGRPGRSVAGPGAVARRSGPPPSC